MCGIVGSVSKGYVSDKIIKHSLSEIKHRGPNNTDYSRYSSNNLGNIFFGHTRLSILDLSNNGAQPMSDSDLNIHIVFNGEIYNFKEIRKELHKNGYSFKSNSDTEVIISAYKEWGIRCVEKFIGMFSFAIFDQSIDKIYLVRDRLGIKPLYYFWDNINFAFSSELKGMLELPFFKKEIDQDSLSLYTNFQYIPAPFSIFKNTFKLNPGCYLEISENKIQEKRYWDANNFFFDKEINFDSDEDAINQLEKLIISSIDYRMISDVPIGSFLSGGIDSSLVSAVMQSLSKTPVETFSLGFNIEGYNEAPYAKNIANYLGTSHNELYVNSKQTKDIIPKLSTFYDEPYADSSAIPTMIISSLAKKKVTVVLSGDGGDELFGGYTRYQSFKKLNSIPSLFKPITAKSLQWIGKNNFRFQKAGSVLSWKEPGDAYASLSNAWYPGELNNILNFDFYEDNPANKYFKSKKSIEEQLMFADLHLYMVDDILTKVDRASMSVSLESRVPLIDHRIVEFALKLPLSYKIRSGKSKYILRKVLEKYVPNSFFDRPKSGFGIPVREWLKEDLFDWMNDTLSEKELSKHNFFNYKLINKMINDHRDNKHDYHLQLWTLTMFQEWYNQYITS
tara:strand:- start:7878 stop:9734 length:1857 start_codon:yes stop_codon:yes gene_type:complete